VLFTLEDQVTKKGKTKAKATTKKTAAANANASAKKGQQLRVPGTERPNRIPELDKAAEEFRVARNTWQEAGKVMQAKKAVLKDQVKKHGLTASYFYDDEEGDTEEVKPTVEEDVKVNKVKQAKAKSDE
jgi:hypothetical protein